MLCVYQTVPFTHSSPVRLLSLYYCRSSIRISPVSCWGRLFFSPSFLLHSYWLRVSFYECHEKREKEKVKTGFIQPPPTSVGLWYTHSVFVRGFFSLLSLLLLFLSLSLSLSLFPSSPSSLYSFPSGSAAHIKSIFIKKRQEAVNSHLSPPAGTEKREKERKREKWNTHKLPPRVREICRQSDRIRSPDTLLHTHYNTLGAEKKRSKSHSWLSSCCILILITVEELTHNSHHTFISVPGHFSLSLLSSLFLSLFSISFCILFAVFLLEAA